MSVGLARLGMQVTALSQFRHCIPTHPDIS